MTLSAVSTRDPLEPLSSLVYCRDLIGFTQRYRVLYPLPVFLRMEAFHIEGVVDIDDKRCLRVGKLIGLDGFFGSSSRAFRPEQP